MSNTDLQTNREQWKSGLQQTSISEIRLALPNGFYTQPVDEKEARENQYTSEARYQLRQEPYQYLCVMLNRIRGCVTEDDYRNLLPQFIQI